MRKMATSFLAAGLVLTAFASAAMAGSLLTESFTYPDGNLTSNATWSVYSGTIPTDIQVVSGQAAGTGNAAPDDHTALSAARLATDKTYMCFDVSITDPGGAPKLVYFAELKDAGSSLLVGRTYVVPLTAGGWTFGVSVTSTNTTTAGVTPFSNTSLNFGQTYKVVVAYDGTAKTATLWVDPVDESSTNVVDTNAGSTSVAVDHFGLRQSSAASAFPPNGTYGAGSANWAYNVDNVGVGVSMADACGAIVPTEHSTWGKIKTIYRH
jgi:hypothetical protein